jgi:hypothetical protein
MDIFTRADCRELIAEHGPPCVSLFLPTHRGGSEQDPIRFRKLLGRVEGKLADRGMRPAECREFLAPLQALLDDPTFWPNQCDGLAAFLSAGFLRVYRLPWAFQEELQVGRLFRVTPLLPLLFGDGRFFVLAISQNSVRLFQGTRFSVSPVDLKGVPGSLADALKTHDRDEVLTFYGRRRPVGGWETHFHGLGASVDEEKGDLLRYFRAIDRGLHEMLRQERAPLVLAAVGYYLPLYRETSTYPRLLKEGIEGSPDHLSDRELHDRAWPIVAPHFEEARKRAIALYHQLTGTGRATADVKQAIPAAYRGELEMLFVATGKRLWGTFGPEPDRLVLRDEPEASDEELVNFAAAHALRHGNAVYVLPSEEMPAGEFLAGLYHLPLPKHGKRP